MLSAVVVVVVRDKKELLQKTKKLRHYDNLTSQVKYYVLARNE